MTNSACYIFLGILSVICIMNLVNTMINSVNVRRKELGMMQAIGMSDRQMQRMLLTEGLFYTLGTLVLSLGVGSAAGIIIGVLVIVQIVLALVLGSSVKKESLIDRIRFSE